ncbi:MAG: PA2779 family protein [Desulfobacterales bacterium]|jgi:hypothetical protein
MKMIRANGKRVSVVLTILMLCITIPHQSVMAAMIGTEAALDSMQAQQARDDLTILLSREDVQNALMGQGIHPVEAQARIDSLSDAEVSWIAEQIDKIPAGGGFEVGALILIIPAITAAIVLIIAFVYVLVND